MTRNLSQRRRNKGVAAVTAAAAASMIVAACGGSSNGTSLSSQGSAAKKLPVFVLGQTLVSPTSADLWVALANGYFTKAGVDVQVKVQGATATTDAAAGRDDIVQSGVTGSFSPRLKGHPTQVIYEVSPGLSTTGVIVSAKSPYKTVMDLSGKSVTVLGVGTSTYGAAVSYSKYIVSHGGKALKIIPASEASQQTNSVVSGSAAASVGLLDIFGPAIAANKVRVLEPAAGDLARSLFPSDIVNIGYWGLESNLAQKKTATTAFVAGLRMADQWLQTASDAQVAQALKKTSFFDNFTEQQIEQDLKYDRPFFTTNQGFISQQAWDASLKEFGTWGMNGVDVNSSELSYDSIVNMSYWNSATSLVNRG